MASTLLTTADLKKHLTESGLEDAALGRLIDAADAEIQAHYGAHYADGDQHYYWDMRKSTRRSGLWPYAEPERWHRMLSLPYAAGGVSVVEEYDDAGSLNAVDVGDWYFVEPRELRRTDGDGWATRGRVTWRALSRDHIRRQGLIDLVWLAVRHRGVDSEDVGEYSVSISDYEYRRMEIIASMRGLRPDLVY